MEVGAMLEGGVSCHQNRALQRGEEMGHFELAGSTVLLLLSGQVRERLSLEAEFFDLPEVGLETPVTMGQRLGELHHE